MLRNGIESPLPKTKVDKIINTDLRIALISTGQYFCQALSIIPSTMKSRLRELDEGEFDAYSKEKKWVNKNELVSNLLTFFFLFHESNSRIRYGRKQLWTLSNKTRKPISLL